MAEFLIMAEDTAAPDSAGKWYGAQFVVVAEDGHEWGGEEGPPVFFIVKVPGISKADAEEYIAEWRHNPTYAVVNSNLPQDGFRIKMTSDAVSASGKGTITLSQVRSFFERWGATIQSSTSDSVTFDIRIYHAITSEAFWERDVSGVQFAETEYNQSTGSHLVEVITPAVTEQQIQQVCQMQGVVYSAPRSFIATRAEVRTKFQDEIASKFRDMMIERRRWRISSVGMDALRNAGGIMTITPQQFVANITDGFTQ
jgi:hypothetical protein